MTALVVTGAAGFIGKNLCEALRRCPDVSVIPLDVENGLQDVNASLAKADAVFHLAGVNRPQDEREFDRVNVGSMRDLVDTLEKHCTKPVVVFSSSTQAALENPYGASKRRAEEILEGWATRNGSSAFIVRLPGVFGKWCRPNYNSVVATFCHNVAHDLDISISDPQREIELVYIDDVVSTFIGVVNKPAEPGRVSRPDVEPVYRVSLGALAATIRHFRDGRRTLEVPDFSEPFTRCLYATYLSYLEQDDFAYDLQQRKDARGALAELLKSPHFGQIFVSRTAPGVVRGNHYHNTKAEKFCVLEGEAVIRFRHLLSGEVATYRVSGRDFRVLDIPPGYAHSIENVGSTEMIVLFWAGEVFDPQATDTYPCEVLSEKA
jgi:UDP-2-acetamido-2,6-beta-L-arabino-hexul-4-ose reductase